ncbi:iron ABC transporter substrate-binding protein [Psychrobacter raelei]|uniref:iron ABC transporter substrate-binding protein n=1 Tax=Psychrobacter raelei TaxID=2565531 RepID=UPI003F6122C4
MLNPVRASLPIFAKATLALMVAALSLTGLVGCSSRSDTDTAQDKKEQPLMSQERFQVGTDLDIAMLKPLSDAYKQETGISIEWVPVDRQVFTIHFDEEPPLHFDVQLPKGVDMLMMHSAYSLADANASHVLQPVGSEKLTTRVPAQYKDPQGHWFGVAKYARTLVYNRNKVNEPELINYAGLAAKKWYGRLCMTDIYSPENQAIAKMMMSYRGTKLTPEILANWQTNMGRPSASNEDILKNIEQGRCDVGIVDSDVFWHHAKTHPDTPIRLMWANQINRGTLTNTISIGMIDEGEEVGQALRFMEWLVSDRGQALLAFYTSAFPVVDIKDDSINMQALRPEWTEFEPDLTALPDIIANHSKIEPLKMEPEPVLEDKAGAAASTKDNSEAEAAVQNDLTQASKQAALQRTQAAQSEAAGGTTPPIVMQNVE